MVYIEIVFFLVIILVAAIIFTNALEHLGQQLKISEGVTGSLFAAVGTALPETMIPILAIFFAGDGSQETSHAIGVGAILGAPLLLATLAMFLMMITVIGRRKPTGNMEPEPTGLRRDLDFFLIAYALATVALFIPSSLRWLSIVIAVALIILYPVYIWFTVKASSDLVAAGHDTEAGGPMYASWVGLPTNTWTIILQVLVGLALLVWGAEGFIHGVEVISSRLGISALLLALLIAPVATELPEKINSILWVRKDRDTLAFGNVTGAMVFQGSLLPALGIIMTPWDAQFIVVACVASTLAASVWLRLMLARGHLKVWHLAINGALYIGYLVVVLAQI